MVFKRDCFPPNFESFVGGSGQLGISVDELSPQLSEYFGTKEGVLVTTVRDNSNASRAGVKAGDVITSLNGGTVDDRRRPPAARAAARRRRRVHARDRARQETDDAQGESRAGAPRGPRRGSSCSRAARPPAVRACARAEGGPTSVASCAATIVAAASFASCRSESCLTSAAMTPTQPPGVTSGAAIAPAEISSAMTVCSSDVLKAAAVAFSASRGIVPEAVDELLRIPLGEDRVELAAVGIGNPQDDAGRVEQRRRPVEQRRQRARVDDAREIDAERRDAGEVGGLRGPSRRPSGRLRRMAQPRLLRGMAWTSGTAREASAGSGAFTRRRQAHDAVVDDVAPEHRADGWLRLRRLSLDRLSWTW